MAERASLSGKLAMADLSLGDSAVAGGAACRFRGGDINVPDLLIRDRGIDPASRGHAGRYHRLIDRERAQFKFIRLDLPEHRRPDRGENQNG